ncbi:MAG: hypothetical protein JSV80_05730 [Acidobacteriota bacterium]|nr:MAG: hypothetical protein JSV80_05730 [Acidobacteriota bacterium]
MDLPLGPILVRVEQMPIAWEPFVPQHYAPFARPVAADRTADLTIRCHEGRGIVVALPPPGGSTVIDVEPQGPARFTIRSHWQDGWVDLARGIGEVKLTERRYLPFRMSLENFLRVASQLLLVERQAFLMHSAGVLDNERCYLMFGPSGAGKSTATANSAPRPALSDDMVLVDVSGDVPLAHAVPFFGAYPPLQRQRGAWPIAAALRLRQHQSERLERLSPARAVATVSASVPFVHELGIPSERLTRLVARLCGAVPAYELYLTKSARFWELIETECP